MSPGAGINQRGFSLIEIMIVVAIVAILAAIAFPNYLGYKIKGNRAEGRTALLTVAQRLERCATTYGSYNHVDCDVAASITGGNSISSESNRYTITATISATAFTLSAAPQFGDGVCGTLTLTSTGVKGESGTAADWKECW